MREQDNSPFANKPAKLKYMWRDLERRAEAFNIPFDLAPQYSIDANELANHVATLAAAEGWCPEFTQAAYHAWFIKKQDPGDPENLRAILESMGRSADLCIANASAEITRPAYATATNRARELGIFGSPTFVVNNELFWGDDRLEDAMAWSKRAHS